MSCVSIGLFAALAEVMMHYGRSYDTAAFWWVMGITAVIAVINFAEGLRRAHA